jgi:hypothetical protein
VYWQKFFKTVQFRYFLRPIVKSEFGMRVALFIRQVLCHCRMADVCDDDGVSGESLREKGAQAPFFFYTDQILLSCKSCCTFGA